MKRIIYIYIYTNSNILCTIKRLPLGFYILDHVIFFYLEHTPTQDEEEILVEMKDFLEKMRARIILMDVLLNNVQALGTNGLGGYVVVLVHPCL